MLSGAQREAARQRAKRWYNAHADLTIVRNREWRQKNRARYNVQHRAWKKVYRLRLHPKGPCQAAGCTALIGPRKSKFCDKDSAIYSYRRIA